MQENKVHRLLWIDYLKGMCMMAVIMSHIGWPEWYGRFLSPFFLTGFFFASGYTFNRKNSFRVFLIGKIKSLVIPILTLGCINAVLAYWVESKSLLERLLGLFVQRPGGWDDLWFVACLFTMEIMFYGITALKSFKKICIIVTILLIMGYSYRLSGWETLPWHIENACILMIFLLGGYIVKITSQGGCFLNLLKNKKLLLLLCLIYIIFICILDNYPIDIHLLQYNSLPSFMITAILGVIIIVGIAINLEKNRDNLIMKYLQFVGKNTIVYYAFQFKAIRIFALILPFCGISNTGYLNILIYTLLSSLLLIVPAILINKYFPFLIGKNK